MGCFQFSDQLAGPIRVQTNTVMCWRKTGTYSFQDLSSLVGWWGQSSGIILKNQIWPPDRERRSSPQPSLKCHMIIKHEVYWVTADLTFERVFGEGLTFTEVTVCHKGLGVHRFPHTPNILMTNWTDQDVFRKWPVKPAAARKPAASQASVSHDFLSLDNMESHYSDKPHLASGLNLTWISSL